MLKITKNENIFENYLSHSYAPARLTPLVCVLSHSCLLEGVRVHYPGSVVATSSLYSSDTQSLLPDHWWSAKLAQVVWESLYETIFCVSRTTKIF